MPISLFKNLLCIGALSFAMTIASAWPDLPQQSMSTALADDGDGDGGDGDGGDGDGDGDGGDGDGDGDGGDGDGDGDGGDGDGDGDGGDGDGDGGGGSGGSGGGGGGSGGGGGGSGGGSGGSGGGAGADGGFDRFFDRENRSNFRPPNFRNAPAVRTLRRVTRPRRTPRPRARRAAPAAPVLQERADREVVALGLSDAQINALVTQGYAILQQDTVQSLGVTVVRLQVPGATSLEDARAAIAAVEPQAAVDFNHYYRTGQGPDNIQAANVSPPAEPACIGPEPSCVAPQLVNWPSPHDQTGACRPGIRIGLIDTGINAEHETFAGANLEVINAAEEGLRESSRQHGTAVAAILIGSHESRSPGLLPEATVIAVDAFYRTGGRDERSDTYTLVKAMDLLADRDVAVMNLSLAGPPNALLERIVNYLNGEGVILVAAAGNAGPKADPAFPGAYPGVITVTAIDNNKRVYRRAGRGDHIDFAAPGVNVWTAASIRGARFKTGTSFAVPFVTAAVALLGDRKDLTNPDDVLDALSADSLDLGEEGKDPVYGFGLIQASGLCTPETASATGAN